jgi:hypothetical protein
LFFLSNSSLIINIPKNKEYIAAINIVNNLLIWVLFDFDFIALEFIYDLNELLKVHVEIFLNVFVPSREQVAQGVIDHKIYFFI